MERRRARQKRKKLSDGLQLVFGGGMQMAAVLITVGLFVFGIWSWWQSESKNQVFTTPSISDWKAMNQAVARRNPALCDRIDESAAERAPSGVTAFPVRTLRDECRDRVIAKKRADAREAARPLDAFRPSEPANAGAWVGYKPKKLKEYDRLGEILQAPEPAPANELPRAARPTSAIPINSGINDQQRRQPQMPPADTQRQLSR